MRSNMLAISIVLLLFTVSCNSKYDTYYKTIPGLKDAGSNKQELLKVFNHYKAKPGDSLKLKAAVFLINEMDGLKTLDTESVASSRVYFDLLQKVYEKNKKKLDASTISKNIDSLDNTLSLSHSIPNPRFLPDIENVSADFLIENIDDAFTAWTTMPWSKNISFTDFCEYILPYRCTDTYMKGIRRYFMEKYKWVIDSVKDKENCFEAGAFIVNDIDSWFYEDMPLIKKYAFLDPIKFSDLLKGKIGKCTDVNSLRVTALRAMGIPAAYDLIPGWANFNSQHFWYKIIDPRHDTITALITNEQAPRNTQHIISASSYKITPVYPGMPSYEQLVYLKTVSKVFRQCFNRQPQSLAAVNSNDETIPAFFESDRMLDVTDKYLETTDLNLTISEKSAGDKFVYLSCFDNKNWNIVAWATLNGNKAVFKKLGKNILYLPVYYRKGDAVPAGKPFVLTLDGKVKEITPGEGAKQQVALYTKFPYRSYISWYASYMLTARFMLANKPDLSDTVTVHTITQIPFYYQEVPVYNNNKYRYLLYRFDSIGIPHVAEIEFWGIRNGREVKLTGNKIGNPGKYGFSITEAMDSNAITYFNGGHDDPRYIGIDLGENNGTQITKITFRPRSDGNAVEAGQGYELFYWKNDWVSLGKKTADTSRRLLYNNVPAGSLLWLKDLNNGTENRIFTYENGKQLFW